MQVEYKIPFEKSNFALLIHSEDVYEGFLVDNIRHGFGKYTWKDGDSYIGEWKFGKMHGKGCKTMQDGSFYDGEWNNGLACGSGTKVFSTGDVHIGEYKNNLRHGFGTYIWNNNTKYVGYWKNGVFHGKGTYYYGEGIIFSGDWENGNKHGKGIASDCKSLTSFEEEWKEDVLISKRKIDFVPSRFLETKKESEIDLLRKEIDRLKSLLEEKHNHNTSKDDMSKDDKDNTCKICYSNKINSVFVPCGHLCSCIECSKNIEACPICRLGIDSSVRIFPN